MKTLLRILILIEICLGDYSPLRPKCSEKRIIKQHNFNDCTQVILLTLQECRNTFNGDLKNVRLTKVPQTVFHYSKETKDINLRKNNIEEIQEETFNGLFSVKKLDLSSNKISSVNSVMFSDLNQLNILNQYTIGLFYIFLDYIYVLLRAELAQKFKLLQNSCMMK